MDQDKKLKPKQALAFSLWLFSAFILLLGIDVSNLVVHFSTMHIVLLFIYASLVPWVSNPFKKLLIHRCFLYEILCVYAPIQGDFWRILWYRVHAEHSVMRYVEFLLVDSLF